MLQGEDPADQREIVDVPLPDPPWHHGPVVQLMLPLPVTLACELMTAVAEVCADHGLETYFTEADGLAVIHASIHARPE